MEANRSLLNNLSSVVGEYLGLRTDDFRRKIVSALSVGFSRAVTMLVIVILLLIVLAVFAFAFIVLLGDAIGSWSGAAFIVGGVYLIALLILFLLRKKLFLKTFTNIFENVMPADEPASDWKSAALVIVRYLRGRIDG